MALRDLYPRFEDRARKRFGQRRAAVVASSDARYRPGLLSILWRRKGLVLAVLATFVALGIIYVLITPPRYMASTSILIDPRLGKTVGSDPVQPGYIVDSGAMDSQIKLFTSQTVLARVGKMAGLADDPEFNGSERSLLQRLLHPVPDLVNGVDLVSLEKAITVTRPERTYVVGVDVLASTPAKAAEIANDLAKAYIEDQVNARIDAAQDDTKFVREQIAKVAGQIKDAEDKVEAFKTKNNIVDINGLRSNEQQVADLSKALGEARARTSDAKAKRDEVARMEKTGKLGSINEAMRSLTIERLRTLQADTEQSVARLATTLGPRHPELKEARGRQAKIDKLIRDELHRLATAANGEYQVARDNEKQIAAQVDQLTSRSADISSKVAPLQQLERNVKVLRDSFDRFSQIRDNLTQQEADSPPGRILAIARPPVSPARPRKKLVALVSVGAGLFFGLAAALLAEGTDEPSNEVPSRPVVYDEPEPSTARPRPRSGSRRYWDEDEV